MMGKHIQKKILPEYYTAVKRRTKTFELRQDEDDIQPGDFLVLREWDGEKYTGRQITRAVTYVLRDCPEFGLIEGHCVIGIREVGWETEYYATAQCRPVPHVMSVNEVQEWLMTPRLDREPIYVECKDGLCCWIVTDDCHELPEREFVSSLYGKTWRCWTWRPVRMHMEAVEWQR